MRFSLFFIAILAGCAATNPWKLESIATGEALFDSARLTYSDTVTPLRFEIVRIESGIETFLSLTKYKFTTANGIKIEFDIAGEKSEETVPFLEGKMRLRLPAELSERLINALQEGKEVAMIADGFEQHLNPDQFTTQYEKLAGKKAIFRNPFKGIFDP